MSEAADIAKAALSRGDLIGAYDATVAAIAEGDTTGAIRHQQILALARMGDTERAMEPVRGLWPRPLDRCRRARDRRAHARRTGRSTLPAGPARQEAMERAFEAYHDVYRESGDSFPGINAATLALLAGREAQSRALAAALLDDPAVAAAGDYYKAATRAEALLLLGRTDEVTEALGSDADQRAAPISAAAPAPCASSA